MTTNNVPKVFPPYPASIVLFGRSVISLTTQC